MTNNTEAPKQSNYDIVIVGGAIMGSSTAWFLTENKDFDGRVLVVERDTSYSACSTAHTNSCMRQQFSTDLNCLLYTSPSPRDATLSRMPSSA